MATKSFSIELLDEISWLKEDFEVISDEIYDQMRWSVEHYLVFREKATGDVYSVCYSTPATECQECEKWQSDGEDMVECTLMKAVEVTRIEYVAAD